MSDTIFYMNCKNLNVALKLDNARRRFNKKEGLSLKQSDVNLLNAINQCKNGFGCSYTDIKEFLKFNHKTLSRNDTYLKVDQLIQNGLVEKMDGRPVRIKTTLRGCNTLKGLEKQISKTRIHNTNKSK